MALALEATAPCRRGARAPVDRPACPPWSRGPTRMVAGPPALASRRQLVGAAPDLDHRAGGGVDVGVPDGLDRVDDQQSGWSSSTAASVPAGRSRPPSTRRGPGRRGARPDDAPGSATPRRRRAGPAGPARPWPPRPGAAGSTCRCPARRRAGSPTRAPARRRARGRARRPRSAHVARVAVDLGERHGHPGPAGAAVTSRIGSEGASRPGAVVPKGGPVDLLDQRVPLAADRAASRPSRGRRAAGGAAMDGSRRVTRAP